MGAVREIQCKGCGKTVKRHDPRARYCDRNCQKIATNHTARTAKRQVHDLEFIMVDGEGIGRGRGHKYVLLGCGSKQIQDKNGLEWEAIFEFLYSCYQQKPDAVYAGYFLGYDFTQWFRSMPRERAHRLLSSPGIASRKRKRAHVPPFPVELRGESVWEIDSLGSKRIKIRPKGKQGWMYICDAGPFFQMSFLSAIDPDGWAEPICTQEEYEQIKTGKERRDNAQLDEEMCFYNRLENDIGSRLMGRLNEGFVRAGVYLKKTQWFGPGQPAQEWLNLQNVPTSEELETLYDPAILHFAQCTYFGGWFEIMCHGLIPGTAWEYDINSAYPYIMSTLPCLLHGRWIHGTNGSHLRGHQYAMVKGHAKGSNPYIGAMSHRNAHGDVLRPHKTAGWFWRHEIDAAIDAGLIDTFDCEEYWEYLPCDCPPPLAGIRELYEDRKRVGKDSSAGKALKLLYNCPYGKFAQSTGDPKYGNPIYASLITAGCRTQILKAIASHPNGARDTVMVATDGVYFLSRHPNLPISKELGEWSVETKENLTLFKPGVYWDDKARLAISQGRLARFKARGVNSNAFSKVLESIDEQFAYWGKRFPQFLDARGREWPEETFKITFAMVSAIQALMWNKWELAGAVYDDVKVTQSSIPFTKRATWDDKRWVKIECPWGDGEYADNREGRNLFRTCPQPFARGWHEKDEEWSSPYKKTFGMGVGQWPDDILNYGVHPDHQNPAEALTSILSGKLE